MQCDGEGGGEGEGRGGKGDDEIRCEGDESATACMHLSDAEGFTLLADIMLSGLFLGGPMPHQIRNV